MVTEYKYRGHRILDCAWAGDPHGGRWYVVSYHHTGMQWADEATPHHRTLAEAREYIDASILDFAGWGDNTTEAIARAIGLID